MLGLDLAVFWIIGPPTAHNYMFDTFDFFTPQFLFGDVSLEAVGLARPVVTRCALGACTSNNSKNMN